MSWLQILSFKDIDIKPKCTIDVKQDKDSDETPFKVISIKYRPAKPFPYELILFGLKDSCYRTLYCNKFGDVIYKGDRRRVIGNITKAYNYYVKPIKFKNMNETNYGEF